MTGPEHYREADFGALGGPLILQRAQVHATLALTAAVALFDDEDFDWKQAVRS